MYNVKQMRVLRKACEMSFEARECGCWSQKHLWVCDMSRYDALAILADKEDIGGSAQRPRRASSGHDLGAAWSVKDPLD
jgi:hypothetical protein